MGFITEQMLDDLRKASAVALSEGGDGLGRYLRLQKDAAFMAVARLEAKLDLIAERVDVDITGADVDERIALNAEAAAVGEELGNL